MLTGWQMREARELLGWNTLALAKKTGIHVATLNRAEVFDGCIKAVEVKRLRRALEAAGIEFTNGDQPGVRLRKQSDV